MRKNLALPKATIYLFYLAFSPYWICIPHKPFSCCNDHGVSFWFPISVFHRLSHSSFFYEENIHELFILRKKYMNYSFLEILAISLWIFVWFPWEPRLILMRRKYHYNSPVYLHSHKLSRQQDFWQMLDGRMHFCLFLGSGGWLARDYGSQKQQPIFQWSERSHGIT